MLKVPFSHRLRMQLQVYTIRHLGLGIDKSKPSNMPPVLSSCGNARRLTPALVVSWTWVIRLSQVYLNTTDIDKFTDVAAVAVRFSYRRSNLIFFFFPLCLATNHPQNKNHHFGFFLPFLLSIHVKHLPSLPLPCSGAVVS